jgi:hypothetical protein
MKFKVESGIPIHATVRKKRKPKKDSMAAFLKQLKIGQSFVLARGKASSLSVAAKKAGVSLTTRSLGDGTVRVWRVDPNAVHPEA